MHTEDSPGTWEASIFPRTTPEAARDPKPRRQDAPFEPATSQKAQRGTADRGNEGMRDGERGVGASRSTDENGEPEPRGPGGGKGEPDLWNRSNDR
jgi:hypothetical protein